MQPLYVTAYGNKRELFGQPLMEMEKDCLANAYSNSVLQITQHCLTAYAKLFYSLRNTVLQITAIMSYNLRQ
jgi:hypothetical protein